MKNLLDYFGKKLEIIQPSFFRREFEFRSGEELLAKMYTPKFFSRTAVIEGDLTGNWEFYFPKFFSFNIEVRKSGYELPIATYHSNIFSMREIIELPNGHKLIYRSYHFKSTREILNENDEILIKLNFRFSLKFKVDVFIFKKSELIDKYPWLPLLAVYIELQSKRRKS